MKRKKLKNFLLVAVLIVATGAAMAYSSNSNGFFSVSPTSGSIRPQASSSGNLLSVSGHVIQNKVLQGSDGIIGLNLTLQAAEISAANSGEVRNVDMVIVLDRSGSMKGQNQ